METRDVLPAIVKGSGRSMQSISTSMGRSRTYIANVVNRGTTLQVDTLAEIADECGYDLKLDKRNGSETIVIDPPQRE